MKATVAAVLSSLLVLAGAGRAAAQVRLCIPGAQIECPCLGGSKAVQVCAPDGMSLLPCQCAAQPPPSASAAAPRSMTPAGFTIAPAASAAPGLLGSINVSAPTPAAISVDGGEVGRAPVHVRDLQPGVHIVDARFDSGGDARTKVRVSAGEATVIVMDPPPSAQAAVWRRGVHIGAAVSTEFVGLKDDFEDGGPAVVPELVANLGVSQSLDLRVGARLILANAQNGTIMVAGIPVSARFNLGSVFALGIGAFTGVSRGYSKDYVFTTSFTGPTYPRETGLLSGIEAFPAIFRLGAKREIELGTAFGFLYHVTTQEDVIHFGVNVTYLFL